MWSGRLRLSYLLKAGHGNPWLPAPDLTQWVWAQDDLGNRYPTPGQASGSRRSAGNWTASRPFASYYDMWVQGIDSRASRLTLVFDRYGEIALYLTLSLKGGGEDG